MAASATATAETASDMNNTFTALEALYYSKYLERDQPQPGAKDLNWTAAIHFIQSCQNLPAYNKEPWASDDPQDKGGFIYQPGNTKAATITNADGRVALRSYGSISYAGLLSYIYADLKPDDPRVAAVYDWLRRNFTVDENPGMGQQGLFYYLHLMTKALAIHERSVAAPGRPDAGLAPPSRHEAHEPPKVRRLLGQRQRPLVGT